MADGLNIDQARLKKFGQMMFERFGTYEKDRKVLEDKWLRDLRQFHGKYDPDVVIPKNQSTAYPKITRRFVIGTRARLMEMLFPQTEKNWGVDPSPIPNLSQADLTRVLDEVSEGLDEQMSPEATNNEIEKAIKKFAKIKADRMAAAMTDQLAEMDYVTLAGRVVQSGTIYGVGLLEGPLVKTTTVRAWQRNPVTRKFEAKEVTRRVPYYEDRQVWDWYPDLSAKRLNQQDGHFFRHVMSRTQVRDLANRKDFMGDQIKAWLAKNTSGNYKARHWETELREKGTSSNVANLDGRKYEVYSWYGFASGHDLRAAGVRISEDKLSDEFESIVWILGDTIIKCIVNPTVMQRRQLHHFIYEEDDASLVGTGVPGIVRDSQMVVCDAVRMLLDNCSVTCGPNLLVRTYLLEKGHNYDMHSRKIWYQDEEDPSGKPAVENISVDDHADTLMKVVQMFLEFAEQEASLPPPALGDPTKGGSEALRTMGGASMLFGAAALPIRNTVRNFDQFTLSFVQSLIDWNMEFNPDDTIKGDFQPIARGSTSLIAKEVRAQALDSLAQTIQPEERIFLKGKDFLTERLRSRDVDFSSILEDDDVVKQKLEQQAATAEKAQAQQFDMIQKEIAKLVSEAVKNIALAQKATASVEVDQALAASTIVKDQDDTQIAALTAAQKNAPKAE